MKKNLQLALAIMLGLATTTVTAQDWSVDSETRMTNMSTDDADMNGFSEQFVRMGVSWGTEDVSVHASFNGYADLNYADGIQDAATFGLHEAYASTDAMGFATLSAGRKAVTLGSGMIIGSNDWNNAGNVFDGVFVDLNMDFADVSLAMSRYDEDNDGVAGSANSMWMNVAKDMGNMAFNFTYASSEAELDGMDLGSGTAMGLEGTYDLDMGATVSFGYYTATETEEGFEDYDMGLTSLGVSYEVMDGFTAHAGYDMYDENGFWLSTSNVLGWGAGTGMMIIDMEGTDMSFGASYDMGDFSFGATMHQFESEEMEGVTTELDVMDFGASYSFNDNASLGVKYSTASVSATDVEDVDMPDMMWMSLNVSF